jgi:hypothetical protein
MLQLIDTTCSPDFQLTSNQTQSLAKPTLRWTLCLTLGLAALISVSVAPAAMAQDPNVPATTQSGKPVVAAPGTVAVSAATAAALQPYVGPSYDNRWEVYGGLLFMNGQAGQNLPQRFNMGGAEAMGTYWLGNGKRGFLSKLGLAADGRFAAGTTPVNTSHDFNRVVVMEGTFMGGVQYRGPRNRYAALDLHVLGGGAYGIFNYAPDHYPGGSPVSYCPTTQVGYRGSLGLYCNHVAPYGSVGGSIDFNQSARLAVRLQPDLTFEHFGTETREFFSVSLGVIYRMGKVR